jgi:two-component system, cell cycle sensor histidine kinase and response regulator CckA
MAANILVLEPEPVCLRYICRVLWKAGYSVLEATTCEEAVRLCAENNGSIPLLIADVSTGEQYGLSTAQLLRSVWPDMFMLFTGTLPVEYWLEADYLRAARLGKVFFLDKPFAPSDLRREVEKLVGTAPLVEAAMPASVVAT